MTHEPQPLVGVVIPVYNDWAGLQRCLQALARQSYPSDLLRVRVVDNGSSDWPPQPLFPRSVEVIRHAKPGSYGARNKAALEWEVDVLAFTDADCEPDPHWIAAGVQALQLGSTPPGLWQVGFSWSLDCRISPVLVSSWIRFWVSTSSAPCDVQVLLSLRIY